MNLRFCEACLSAFLVVLLSVGKIRGAETPKVEPASAGQPFGWRGDGTGRFPSAQPATKWSTTQNLRWKTEVGKGESCPVLAGGRVFVTVEPDLLVCLDAETGKERWRKPLRFSDIPGSPHDPGQSSQYGDMTPTPVSDGKYVWVFAGTGIVACYDLEGKRQWIQGFDLPLTTAYGRTASPVLIGDRFLVHFGPLVCLDARTGKLLWKNDAEASYGTPVWTTLGETHIVITPKGSVVRVSDGKILATDLGNCMYSSPVVQDNTVYFIEGESTAVRLPAQAAEQMKCQELWSVKLEGEFYASPVLTDERIYAVDKSAKYFVVDAKTGHTLLEKTLEFSRPENTYVYPSLCLAGKHLFIGNDAGESFLLSKTSKARP